jgi:hypothetical protein
MEHIQTSLPEGASHEPCAYCGARPTWPVVWTNDDGTEYTVFLCAECDEDEIRAFNDDSSIQLQPAPRG